MPADLCFRLDAALCFGSQFEVHFLETFVLEFISVLQA